MTPIDQKAVLDLSPGKTIVTHPDNLKLLESAFNRAVPKYASIGAFPICEPIFRPTIRTSPHVEKSRPTHRVITPDGIARDSYEWTWQWDRFTTLEESDLEWAIALGLVRRETEPVFYIMDDFRLFTDSRYWTVPFRSMHLVKYTA